MSLWQDYTTYTELDVAANRIQNIAARSFNIVSLDTDEFVAIYKVVTHNSDFENTLEIKVTANSSGILYPWVLSIAFANDVGYLIDNDVQTLHCLKWRTDSKLELIEHQVGVGTLSDVSSTVFSLNTTYYIRIVRDEAVGTYGTLYCYIYNDAEYTSIIEILSVVLRVKSDFTRLWGAGAQQNGAGGASISALISNLKLDAYPYTLKNLRTRIRDILNLISTSVIWTDAQLTDIINEIVRDIAQKSLCYQAIVAKSTSNGVRTLSGMSSHYDLTALEYITGAITLREIPTILLGHDHPKGATPQFYFENNDSVGIEPLPDATYNLNAYLSQPPTDMSLEPDIPVIRPAFRPLIIWGALARTLEKFESTRMTGRMIENLYLNEIKYLTQEYIDIIPTSHEDLVYQ